MSDSALPCNVGPLDNAEIQKRIHGCQLIQEAGILLKL